MATEQELMKSEHDTKLHQLIVNALMLSIIEALIKRTYAHDESKLESPEIEIFAKYGPKLKDTEYGSDEYKQFLAEMKPALEHHYANNRHHPEHHEAGINDMTLIDIIEMFADWIAATKRMKDWGNFYKSLAVNKTRFGMSDQLSVIFANTFESPAFQEVLDVTKTR